jgi:hypothetical protein
MAVPVPVPGAFASPTRKRHRQQMDEVELHEAKRRLSEKLWGLRLDDHGKCARPAETSSPG